MKLEELVDRYCSAWCEPDAGRRLAILRDVMTPQATYTDPRSAVTGPDALSGLIGTAIAQRPDGIIVRTSGIDCHHGRIRFGWAYESRDGRSLLKGIDIAGLDDARRRLTFILGFFGDLKQL